MSSEKKKIRELTPEERNEYNRQRYEARIKGSTKLVIEINNCTEELKNAIIEAIKESK